MQHDPDNQHAPKKQVDTRDLAIGMHVQELDRPWLETPFLFQGFTLDNQEEIETLQELCDYVYITQDTDSCTSGIQWKNSAPREPESESPHVNVAQTPR